MRPLLFNVKVYDDGSVEILVIGRPYSPLVRAAELGSNAGPRRVKPLLDGSAVITLDCPRSATTI